MLHIELSKELSQREVLKLGKFADDIINSEISEMVNSVIERNIEVEKVKLAVNSLTAYRVNLRVITATEMAEMYQDIVRLMPDENMSRFNFLWNHWQLAEKENV